jgi:alanine racemase
VLVAGQRTQLLGRVSMDMLCIDLTDVPEAGLGSTVELWGKNILASELAAAADTIPYQLFCNLRRVPRVYSGD